MKLLHVVGARPNFPKVAPVHRAAAATGLDQVIVHTGQHYDDEMSGRFFRELEIPAPDVNLGVGSASHAKQTARIIEAIEPVLTNETPDWVVVYGDVNSTMAAALVAAKLLIPVAHVEAGLRSGDRTMPEEINRIVTDRLAELLLIPSKDAGETLRGEGVPKEQIAFVGNVMIDSLFHALPVAQSTGAAKRLEIDEDTVLVTLHRPSNVDSTARLSAVVDALELIAAERRVLFPAHPRTRQRLNEAGVVLRRIELIPPLSYHEMVDAMQASGVAVTDSGGVQEETTALGIPCFTLRDNTERPITISEGTNTLVTDLGTLSELVRASRRPATAPRPDGWDGRAAERVVRALCQAQRGRLGVAQGHQFTNVS
ncbi:MAG TPA: UDP-N-acetylglucosamine 2-epimerase (non-hydrolyzing) [Gemmatimonadaceae bacterium]|nr:UDP-N-acetylglucosamine 2-epimerase (non-hydrolyzing) [Gemmatimonadaceae bacterium]